MGMVKNLKDGERSGADYGDTALSAVNTAPAPAPSPFPLLKTHIPLHPPRRVSAQARL